MSLADDLELPDPDPVKTQAHQLNDAAMHIVEHEPQFGIHAAHSMLRRALALKPDLPQIWTNLGLVCWRLNRIDEAHGCLLHAVELDPQSWTFNGNLGVFIGAMGQTDVARLYLERAIQLDPENLSPQWDLCLLDLRAGFWAHGLRVYDIRRAHRGPGLYPEMPAPLWRGEDLDHKTLYVQSEQGIGDRFLFSRYLAWIKERWPTCTLKACVNDGLTNLFWEFRHIAELLPEGVPWPEGIDYTCFLCSIPEQHGSDLQHVPPDPGLLRRRIDIASKLTTVNLPQPHLPALKVGICWTGSPAQTRNHDRTIPLEMLMPLAEDPRVMLYSFQVGAGQQDMTRLCAQDLICDLGPQIERNGWVGTGIALMEMDLVISVCTSIPHLAGALDVPCWTMLCADPYWVWGRSGESSAWYPGMRLFRQRTLGDWQPVIAEVRGELSRLADKTFP